MRLSGLTAKTATAMASGFRLVLSFRYFADGVVWTGYRQRGILLARSGPRALVLCCLFGLVRCSRSTALGLCGATSNGLCVARYYSAPAA